MLLLCSRHSWIELDQHVARLDALAILGMNGAYDAGLKGLNELNSAARHYFAGSGSDNVDMPENCPDQPQDE